MATWSSPTPKLPMRASSTGFRPARRFSPATFNSQSAPLWNSYFVGGGGLSTVSMDEQDNFALSWEVLGGTDPDGFASEEVLGAEYQLENYTTGPGSPSTGVALAEPVRLRPVQPPAPPPTPPALPQAPVGFRFDSADPTSSLPPGYPTSTVTWPLGVTGSDVQIDADGDIAATYDGNGPAVSGNTLEEGVAIPNTFFEQYFSQEVQQLTFTGVVPGAVFALSDGSGVTGPITFGPTAAATAPLIQTQLITLLSGLGFGTGNFFTPAATVTGTQSGTTWTFKVTFGAGPNEPLIGYVGALSGVTFANSAAAPAANQQLTFSPAGAATTLNNGLFTLKTTLGTSAAIVFNANDPIATAKNIQAALPGSTVTVDPSSTATTFVFDVTFATAKPVLQLAAANTLPPTSTYSAAITTPWNNADLLAYFNPFEGNAVGTVSTFTTAIYQLASAAGTTAIDGVNSAIDQVLYTAQYTPSVGIASANQEQLGRLRNILETVAGALRGESAGVLLSQFDADSQDSQNATFSNSVVSSQRTGQDQRYYIVVPADAQSGTFQIRFSFDGQPFQTTAPITMAAQSGNFPGAPIDANATATAIANALNADLGAVWPIGGPPLSGSVNVRAVPQSEIDDRNGSAYAVPNDVILAESPSVPVPMNTFRSPDVIPGGTGSTSYVFELTFQGQAHDTPITLSIINSATTQWVEVITFNTGGNTTTFTQIGASPVQAFAGDYQGATGPTSYGASLAMTSFGQFGRRLYLRAV